MGRGPITPLTTHICPLPSIIRHFPAMSRCPHISADFPLRFPLFRGFFSSVSGRSFFQQKIASQASQLRMNPQGFTNLVPILGYTSRTNMYRIPIIHKGLQKNKRRIISHIQSNFADNLLTLNYLGGGLNPSEKESSLT